MLPAAATAAGVAVAAVSSGGTGLADPSLKSLRDNTMVWCSDDVVAVPVLAVPRDKFMLLWSRRPESARRSVEPEAEEASDRARAPYGST